MPTHLHLAQDSPKPCLPGPTSAFCPRSIHAFPWGDSLYSVSRNAPRLHFCRFTRNHLASEGGRVPQPGDVLRPRTELVALGTREASKAAYWDDRGPGRFHSSEERVGPFPASGNSAFLLAAGRCRSRALAEEEGKGPE